MDRRPTTPIPSPARRLWGLAGDLALWPALYAAGACLAAAQLAGLHPAPDRIVGGAATAWGLFLLDRVKLRTNWIDPADEQALPDRYRRLRRWARPIRAAAAALLALGVLLGLRVGPIAAALPAMGALGIVIYAGWGPRRPHRLTTRPKDVLPLKPALISAGITAIALAFVDALPVPDPLTRAVPLGASLFAGAFLSLHVLADAILSDLDDAPTDLRWRTRTVPNTLGPRAAWNVAMFAHLIASSVALWAPKAPALRLPANLWAVGSLGAATALYLRRPTPVRTAVDLKLPLVAAAVAVALALLRPA